MKNTVLRTIVLIAFVILSICLIFYFLVLPWAQHSNNAALFSLITQKNVT